ncbi:substrate-binding domain-containing protein [Thalassobaculum sp. OXR-137]|uniref:substrate-binding domain-containing protein n=1 Tax=Thalassobaculum sp. OXR-137 TaxID=3100173 RepID=UPI002AC982F2|nr:substrate-binding domain-containing protein [Thalassobaculum sp. OXR-137]WPZ37074.1 substrate-binding domain-containing protein [Thalassobaculum sp. OXR-137]
MTDFRMRHGGLGALASLVLILAASAFQSARAESTIRIGGTGMGLALARDLGRAYTAQTPGVGVEVLPSMGSTGGMQALADGAIDIGLAGRPLTSRETAGGLDVTLCLITALVFATSHPAPNSIAVRDLPAIYRDPAPTWADGTPLKVILRPHSGSEHPYLASRVPDLQQAFDRAFTRRGIAIGKTDQENAALAARIAGSFAITTLLQIRSEQLDLNVVPIDGRAPTAADAATGAYPFPLQVCFVKLRGPSPAATGFLDFLRSGDGLRIMADREAVPVK